MIRDLGGYPLGKITAAVAEGRVTLDGSPYTWEADPMVRWLEPRHEGLMPASDDRFQLLEG
ncbi:MAG: hypothetical protein H0V89_06235 [Deltaproteobacteria bacterium]|nr:hypothetical protein [Deltaproteobacteria bacterium]